MRSRAHERRRRVRPSLYAAGPIDAGEPHRSLPNPTLFFAYPREERAFVSELAELLEAEHGRRCWWDRRDLAAREDWKARIDAAINEAAVFVFVLTPDSIASDDCVRELDVAEAAGSRVVVISRDDVVRESIPRRVLADQQWVYLRRGDPYEDGVAALLKACDSDLEWNVQLARIRTLALRWEQQAVDTSRLLRGASLDEAERWQAAPIPVDQGPPPDVVRRFIGASQRAARRTRRWGALAALVIMGALAAFAIVALIERGQAVRQAHVALARGLLSSAANVKGHDPSLGAILAIEADRLSSSPASRGALLSALDTSTTDLGSLDGQTGDVFSVLFNRSGSELFSASSDESLRAWRFADRSQDGRPFLGHTDRIFGLSINGAQTMLASAGTDGTVRLWSVRTHRQLGRPLVVKCTGLPPGPVGKPSLYGGPVGNARCAATSVAFSPNGQRVAVAVQGPTTSGDTVQVWDVTTRRLVGQPMQGHTNQLSQVVFTRDGSTILSAGYDDTVRFWDARTLRPVGEPLTAGHGAIDALALSPSQPTFATGGADGVVRLWSLTTRKEVGRPLQKVPDWSGALAFAPNGKSLAYAGGDVVRVVRLSDDRLVIPEIHVSAASLAFSPDGKTLAIGKLTDDRMPRSAGIQLENLMPRPRFSASATDSRTLALSPNGRYALIADGGRVAVRDVRRQAAVGPFVRVPGLASGDRSWAINDTGIVAVAWSERSRVLEVLRPRASTADVRFGGVSGDRGTIDSAAVDATGDHLAISRAGGIRVFAMRGAQLVPDGAPLRAGNGFSGALAFSPDDRTLAAGSGGARNNAPGLTGGADVGGDDAVRLWDLPTHRLRATMLGHSDFVVALQFDSSGQTLASASQDGDVRLWNVTRGVEVGAPLTGGQNALLGLAFSPDSATLAEIDGFHLRLWDVRTGTPIAPPLEEGDADLDFVAFEPQLTTFGGGDFGGGGERRWSTVLTDRHSGPLIARLCARIRRNLTRRQWRFYVPGVRFHATCVSGP
jgi:WD40 repeat protein